MPKNKATILIIDDDEDVLLSARLLLKKHYSYLPFLLLLWAASLGYSRISLGVHYPLDVFTGMFFGGIIGGLFYRLQSWGQIKFNIS